MGQDHPDSNVFPRATGAAEKMVQEHQKEESLKLYSGWFCPFVQRVLLVLLEKNIAFQYIEVREPPSPTCCYSISLTTSGKPLPQASIALETQSPRPCPNPRIRQQAPLRKHCCLEFLEDAYPSTKRLLPSDPYQKARTRIWIDFISSRIVTSYHRFLQYQPNPSSSSSSSSISQVRSDFLSNLKQFTEEMDPTGPFFLGSELSLIDLIIAPWAVRLWVFDHFKDGLQMPKGEAWVLRWEKWLGAVQNRESVVSTMSEREHYLPIYQRYADDTAQSEMAKATRQGKGVP